MQIRELAVRFSETAEEEVGALVNELHLTAVAELLGKQADTLPAEYQAAIRQLLAVIVDLFSTDLPDISSDPETTLRTVSRDINLARLLRERGLFRLYRLLHARDDNDLPLFMSAINPDTGSPFAKQEEFIGWFCSEAKVARSLVFQRMATIDRLLAIDFSLDEAFNLSVTKPYAIRETLNQVATWRGGRMESIDAGNVLKLTERLAKDQLPIIEPLVQAARECPEDEEAQERLRTAAKPVIARLMEEVAEHDRARDAMDWVKHDLLQKPEIKYSYDPDAKALLVEFIPKSIDDSGQEYSGEPIIVPFVPDALYVPGEVITDLLGRLPVRNRPD